MLHRYFRSLWGQMSPEGRRTFSHDLVRGGVDGALLTLQLTFGLLVAIEYFDASVVQKSLIAGAHAMGLLCSLPYAAWSPILGKKKTVRAALPVLASGVGLVLAAAAPSAEVYTIGMVIFGMSGPLSAPIITGIYRDNYRDAIRGQAFGITLMLTAAVGLVVQFVGGGTLEQEVGYYRLFFAALAAATLIKAWAFLGMPAGAAEDEPARNPLGNFSAVWENSLFGYVLAAWFLFGFANLALMPQRIEYLSNPRYGLDLSPLQVTLIVGVTMEAARILVIQVWAQLFDRFNFIKLRIALSSLLLGHILLYYNTASLPLLFAGSALLGATLGGGGIAWMLWVTKFAPPEKTAQYMSIHTFLTGVRGTIAPLVGYLVMEYMKIQTASWLAGGLVMISILMLWRIRNEHPPAVKAT